MPAESIKPTKQFVDPTESNLVIVESKGAVIDVYFSPIAPVRPGKVVTIINTSKYLGCTLVDIVADHPMYIVPPATTVQILFMAKGWKVVVSQPNES